MQMAVCAICVIRGRASAAVEQLTVPGRVTGLPNIQLWGTSRQPIIWTAPVDSL
jgi:hypothetical protein